MTNTNGGGHHRDYCLVGERALSRPVGPDADMTGTGAQKAYHRRCPWLTFGGATVCRVTYRSGTGLIRFIIAETAPRRRRPGKAAARTEPKQDAQIQRTLAIDVHPVAESLLLLLGVFVATVDHGAASTHPRRAAERPPHRAVARPASSGSAAITLLCIPPPHLRLHLPRAGAPPPPPWRRLAAAGHVVVGATGGGGLGFPGSPNLDNTGLGYLF